MRWIFDFECTGAQRNKAHPFDYRNSACNVGFLNIDTQEIKIFKLEYDESPYGENLKQIKDICSNATLLVGVNLKFDLSWLRRYGIVATCKVFDCQLAYYILTKQKFKMPSLDGMAEYFGEEKKLNIVKEEYWNRGLDTNQVPYNILSEYLEQDLKVTYNVYLRLSGMLADSSLYMQRLISLSMQDLLVLSDIEWNGFLLNKEKSLRKGNEIFSQIEIIDKKLKDLFGVNWININSRDHLSVMLYGGTIIRPEKQEYVFTYKDGKTAIKTKTVETSYSFKGLCEPPKGSELAKEGFYSTDESTLKDVAEYSRGKSLEAINLLQTRAKLEKKRSTYFHGLPKKIEEFNWEDNIIHSNFNQCVAVSGRLSSSKPNLQNLEDSVKEVFITRF